MRQYKFTLVNGKGWTIAASSKQMAMALSMVAYDTRDTPPYWEDEDIVSIEDITC